jgi:hypothetical protein
MPIQVDIFNKKILSSQSRFGTYNILLSGDADNNAYPNSNPSGYITGVDLSNYYTKDNPSGYITAQNVVFATGNQTISGNKIFANDITVQGAVLVNQIIDITTTGIISGITGEFKYIKTEGGMVSGGDFEVYADSYIFSGADVDFYGDDYAFSGVNVYIANGTGFFTSKPLVNNIPVLLSGEAVMPSQTGIFYTINNPSGYITSRNVVFTTGNQTISGFKTFADEIIARSGIEIYFSGDQRIGNIISGNWNSTTIAYTGIRYDIRLSGPVVPSATNDLLYMAVNNTGILDINSKGQVLINQLGASLSENTIDVRRNNTSLALLRDDGAFGALSSVSAGTLAAPALTMQGSSIRVGSNCSFGWTDGVNNAYTNQDLFLNRDAANIMAQRNGLNAQQFRVYNYTGTNSGEFATFGWQATGTGSALNALVIGTRATQSGTLRDVILTGRNIFLRPSGDTYIGTPNTGTNRIYLANPRSNSYYQITPNQFNMTIGQIGGTTVVIDSNFVNVTNNFSINGAGYLWRDGSTNGFIGLSDSYGGNVTVGNSNQGFNIYKIASGVNREFLTLGWTGFTGIIGTRIGTSGTLRDLIITGANINLASSGVIIPNPTVPTSTGSEGTRGQISWDNDFIYVCVSGNSWKRAALTTW